MLERLKFYSLADAKARFSKVVEETSEHDVIVTKNGVPRVVLMDYSRYEKLMKFYESVRDLYLLEIGDPSVFPRIEPDLEDEEEV